MFNSEQLLSPDLDVDAYLRYALHSSSLTAEQTRLTGCLNELKEDVQAILAEEADSMVGQLQASHAAQRDVASSRQSVDSLTRATDRLRLMIEEPYNTIQGKITELENTNATVEILRDVLKFISLSSRLQELMGPATAGGGASRSSGKAGPVSGGELDITRAARSLKELEDLCQVADIRGIEVVEARMSIVEKFSTLVRNRMHELLSVHELLSGGTASSAAQAPLSQRKGTRHAPAASPALNKAVLDMGTALQCAYTLGSLAKVVHGFMMERKREALKAIMRELDPQVIAEDATKKQSSAGSSAGMGMRNPGSPTGGAREVLQSTQEALLAHIQAALYMVAQHTQCAILLWRVLLRRQDAVTQAPLFRAIDAPVQLLVDYWNAVMDKLRERLVALQKRGDFEAALAEAYPAFCLLLESLISSSGDLTGTAAAAAVAGATLRGGSSGAGSGGLSSAAVSDSATSLLLFNMPQWGLGDYLDLLQVVDTACSSVAGSGSSTSSRGGGHAVPSSTSAASLESLKSTWLSLVAGDLQRRFCAQLMDRHRERMGPVLSKLSSLIPTSSAAGAQPVNVTAADARRGSLPVAASALDLASYTRVALHDCYAYRQDPLALALTVDCVVATTQQLLTRMREATARHPLPPLPAVTTSVTRTQLLHICMANGSTTLVQDLSNILALLPEQSGVTRGEDGAGDEAATVRHADPSPQRAMHSDGAEDGHLTTTATSGAGGGVAADLAQKQRRLRETVEAFRAISECATLPFLGSARVTLLPAVAYCVDVACSTSSGGGGHDNRAILQLSTRLDVFLNNYFLLVDPRTSEWAGATRRLADALLARLLAQCATVTFGDKTAPAPAAATNRALANCLQEAMIVLLSFASASQGSLSGATGHASYSSPGGAGGIGRSTLMLKGSAKQAELFYSTLGSHSSSSNSERLAQELQAILKPLYPLLARLLLVQQRQMGAAREGSASPSRPAILDGGRERLTQAVEQGLMRFCQSSTPPAHAVADRQSHLSDEELARQIAELEEAVSTYFNGFDGAASVGKEGGGALGSMWTRVWQSVPAA